MQSNDWDAEHAALIKILKEKLGDKRECIDVIGGYEELMRSMWTFMARLFGEAGTKAIMIRSVRKAASDVPLLASVHVRDEDVDLSDLQKQATELGCGAPEVLDAVSRLAVLIFQTLAELTGKTVTYPLLDYLGKEDNKMQGQV